MASLRNSFSSTASLSLLSSSGSGQDEEGQVVVVASTAHTSSPSPPPKKKTTDANANPLVGLSAAPVVLRCRLCPVRTWVSSSNMSGHAMLEHSALLFRCTLCDEAEVGLEGAGFEQFEAASAHVRTTHKVTEEGAVKRVIKLPAVEALRVYQCGLCGEVFVGTTEEKVARSHFLPVHNAKRVKASQMKRMCRVCGHAGAKSDAELIRHIDEEHPVGDFAEDESEEDFLIGGDDEDEDEDVKPRVPVLQPPSTSRGGFSSAGQSFSTSFQSPPPAANVPLKLPVPTSSKMEDNGIPLEIRHPPPKKELKTKSPKKKKVVREPSESSSEEDSSSSSEEEQKKKSKKAVKKKKKQRKKRKYRKRSSSTDGEVDQEELRRLLEARDILQLQIESEKAKEAEQARILAEAAAAAKVAAAAQAVAAAQAAAQAQAAAARRQENSIMQQRNSVERDVRQWAAEDRSRIGGGDRGRGSVSESPPPARRGHRYDQSHSRSSSRSRSRSRSYSRSRSRSRSYGRYRDEGSSSRRDRHHDSVSPPRDPSEHYCGDCREYFTDETAYRHFTGRRHHDIIRNKIRCFLCSLHVGDLKGHLNRFHHGDVFQCKVEQCSHPSFIDVGKTLKHVWEKHHINTRGTGGPDDLIRNYIVAIPSNLSSYQCRHCDSWFLGQSLDKVLQHIRWEHDLAEPSESDVHFQCRICGRKRSFDDDTELQRHVRMHRPDSVWSPSPPPSGGGARKRRASGGGAREVPNKRAHSMSRSPSPQNNSYHHHQYHQQPTPQQPQQPQQPVRRRRNRNYLPCMFCPCVSFRHK